MAHPTRTIRRRRGVGSLIAAGTVVAALAAIVAVSAAAPDDAVPDPSLPSPSLPNPMGGEARTAPGEVAGRASLAGLQIADAEVAMGDVALEVTYVPGWRISNPTDGEVSFTVGEPQVVEGCCPGPVYLDGELTQAAQRFSVPPGGSVHLQFPLQMHAGMDGPHHLAIPLLAGTEQTAVHVRGNFTAAASS